MGIFKEICSFLEMHLQPCHGMWYLRESFIRVLGQVVSGMPVEKGQMLGMGRLSAVVPFVKRPEGGGAVMGNERLCVSL